MKKQKPVTVTLKAFYKYLTDSEGLKKQVDKAQIQELTRHFAMKMYRDPAFVGLILEYGKQCVEEEDLEF